MSFCDCFSHLSRWFANAVNNTTLIRGLWVWRSSNEIPSMSSMICFWGVHCSRWRWRHLFTCELTSQISIQHHVFQRSSAKVLMSSDGQNSLTLSPWYYEYGKSFSEINNSKRAKTKRFKAPLVIEIIVEYSSATRTVIGPGCQNAGS